ncbi:MAG TPA: GLUG motif-containing protein [Candidatus Saccharimonadales bacterium]|nr:GLUG motif-containing protein [Candidatus Saccharimonadales bacterium]
MKIKRTASSMLASVGLVAGTFCAQIAVWAPGHAAALTTHHITTCSELQAINDSPGTWADSFVLDNNIDCSASSGWNDGAGFIPIGLNSETAFTGTFDGQGYTISDLYINDTSDFGEGLFSQVDNAIIHNIDFDGGSVTGYFAVGVAVGAAYDDTEVEDITSNVPVSGEYAVGGAVGSLAGTDGAIIGNIATSGNVTGTGAGNAVGGVVGDFEGLGTEVQAALVTSHTSGVISGEVHVGGLVGYAGGSVGIQLDYATGTASANDGYVGGLIGEVDQLGYTGLLSTTIDTSYATGGAIAGTGESGYVGGLIGFSQGAEGVGIGIQQVFATGDADASDQTGMLGGVGGLIGEAYHTQISDSYATGNVTTMDTGGDAGGLVGAMAYSDSDILNSYATGDVTAYNYLGGLVGNFSGDVTESFALGNVNGLGDEDADTAGLLGVVCTDGCGDDVVDAYWSSTASGQEHCERNYNDSNEPVSEVGCTDESASYFNNNSTNPPFDAWDFVSTWETHTSAPPTLRFAD